MATNKTSSSNPRAEKMGDVLDALSSDRNNARRSLGVFGGATSALAHRRRGPAVLEDRGEGLVPTQRH